MQVYLVGGAVRDTLLGREVKERDYVVVGATPAQMLALGYTQVGKDFPVFLHPKTKDEYALARTERKQGKGYTGFICDFAPHITLEQDLARRDLTINAIAQADDGTLIDPYHGKQDLTNKQLRHIGDAFSEDPLRVLRVARFAARYHYLGFSVAPQTLALMANIVSSGEINSLTPERVWLEWQKALEDYHLDVFLHTLNQCGALAVLSPALAAAWQTQPNAAKNLAAICHYARANNYNSHALFAQLASLLNVNELTVFSQQYKVPQNYSNTALALANEQTLLANPHPTADDILGLFNRLDVWRRPEKISLLFTAFTLSKQGDTPYLTNLNRALQAAKGVNAQTYISQGITGAAIKPALEKGRYEEIGKVYEK